jgi:imidazolonepropionase-like amidohydrolase
MANRSRHLTRTALRLILAVVLASAAAHGQSTPIKAITGVTLIDGTSRPPLRDAVILIDGTRISQVGARGAVSIPAGATVIDGQGKFVIPGLADMHHHLLSGSTRPQQNLQSNLRRMLVVGVTTVFNPSIGLADFAALKKLAAADTAPYARFFGTGPIVTVKGDFLGALVGSPTPDSVSDAVSVVNTLKAAGVDAIKVQRDDGRWSFKGGGFPLMKQDVLTALVRAAHQQGLKVFAHASMLKQAKEALRAGVDGLMHGIIDEPVDQEFLTLMKQNAATYVPTMAMYNDVADVAAWARRQAPSWDKAGMQPPRLYEFFSTPAGVRQFESIFTNTAFARSHLPIQKANLEKVFDAGVPVVLGTDTGFTGVLLGISTQIELELLVEGGLTPGDALRAATINAARMIGREQDFGTVEPGKFADLVILDADPLADIRNVTRIHRTLKGGVEFDPVDPARPYQ